jgi:SH3 domain
LYLKQYDKLENAEDTENNSLSHGSSFKMGCALNKRSQPQRHGTLRRKTLLYKAIADFRPGSKDDLAFRAGDILEILEPHPTSNWWIARNTVTKKQGYIPKNFVAKCGSIESEP